MVDQTFEGHDHIAYEVGQVYQGSNFVHIAQGPLGAISETRVKRMSVHVDDIPALIEALREYI